MKSVKQIRKRASGKAKSIDDKYYGPEPIDVSVTGYNKALNWYNYIYEYDQARTWFFDYLKREKFAKDTITSLKRLPKYEIPTTVGWIARMLLNGNKIDSGYFENRVAELIELAKKPSIKVIDEEEATATKKIAAVVSIQDRIRAKNNVLISDIEEALDNDPKFSLYEFLKAREATAMAVNAIIRWYQPILDEVMSDDEQVKEAYGKRLKAQRSFWMTFMADADRFIGNKNAARVRKPRQKKERSAVDTVKKMKFRKEDSQLKIVSINPAEIVGASQLWTYDTKKRKVSRFDAMGPAGLSVKGTTILGFDPATSIMKATRKPELVVNEILGAGKVTLRRIMDNIKAKAAPVKGRINSEVILLRVVR